jgi:hypothetical protein
MAKSLLLNVLADVLGQYVEGLTKENLKLGVWTGKIEFFNLKLKDSALDQLNLPIQVKKGSLKRLTVKVPWTSLESKPVEVEIDELYLLACPLDLTQNSPEEGRKMNQAMRSKKLKQIDDAVMLSIHNSDLQASAKQASYIQQLVTCIVDNLEVRVSNIHIRYEDSISIPGKTFCCGITLDSIFLTTTDENWNVRFVKRDAAAKASTSVNKLGQVKNVGVYWNISDESQASLSSEEWESRMKEMIYRDDMPDTIGVPNLDFILSPPNQLLLKLTHREVCSETVPNVDLIIETSEFKANFDRQQFKQLMVMNRSFGELDRKRLMCLYRPSKRATEDPRAWWRYAYRLVTGRDVNTASKIKLLHFCLKSREKYIAAVKKFKFESYFHKEGRPAETLPADIALIEEKLPLSTLLLFREEAVKEAAIDIRKQLDIERANAEKASSSPSSSSSLASMFGFSSSTPKASSSAKIDTIVPNGEKKSMFSGWFSFTKKDSPQSLAASSPSAEASNLSESGVADNTSAGVPLVDAEDAEDEKLMNDLELQLQRLNEASESAIHQKFSFRGVLHSSVIITFTYDGGPIVTIRAGMGLLIETRFSNVLLNFTLHNFSVEDQISKDPFDNMLIVMAKRESTLALTDKHQIGEASKVPFTFILEIRPDLLSIRLTAVPVVITWNKDCIKYFIHFITYGTSDDSKKNISPQLKNSLQQFSEAASLPKVDMEIIIDIDAPKIIIPEGKGRCSSYIVLDSGYLSIRGSLNQSGMAMQIALRQVNISMPDTSKQQLTSSYLITPFDFNINIESKDEVNPVVYVDMNIFPGLAADLDAIKLVRIVQVILLLLESLNTSSLDPVKEEEEDFPNFTPLAVDFDTAAMDDDISRIKKQDILESTWVGKKHMTDYSALKARVKFALTELKMNLYISEDHNMELILKDVFVTVLQRAGDTSIDTVVASLVINNSKRTADHPSILLAKPDESSSSDKLLSVVYRIISSKESPFYRGNSAELQIEISRVWLYLDPIVISNFRPLLSDFMEAWMAKIVPIQEAAADADDSRASSSDSTKGSSLRRNPAVLDGAPMKRASDANMTNQMPSKPAKENPLGGVYLEFVMESVGLYLLQPRYIKSVDSASEDLLDHFESSFLFSMSHFDVKISATTKIVITATLSSIELTDLRKRSETMVFKKIFRTGKLFDADDTNEDFTVNNNEHLLCVTFEQDEEGNKSIDVIVRNLSTIVAIDVVMDLVDIIMTHVNSILSIVNAVYSVSAKGNKDLGILQMENSGTEVKVSRPATVIVFSVSVINPRLILLEDPCAENSKAIQTKCRILVRYVINDVGTDCEQQGSFQTSVRDIESFAILDLSRQTAIHRIIGPLGVEINFNTKVISSKMISMQVMVNVQDIFLRMSLNDLVLVQNIATRAGEAAKAKEIATTKEVNMESRQVCKSAEDVPEAENLTIYSFCVILEHLNVILINDYNGQNSPLIRFDATDLEFDANGAMIGLVGKGSVGLISEYYNSRLCCWEPLMERWNPTINISKSSTGISVQISYNRLLQFNVTGELLKCIVGTAALVSRIGKEGSYKSRKKIIALSFRNESGVPVDIVDHKSKQLLASIAAEDALSEQRSAIEMDADFDLSAIAEVDLYFVGDYMDMWAPLQRLSTSSRKPKVYQMHSLSEDKETVSLDVSAPVTEEVYQYSRFNLMKNSWEKPWSSVGDPHEWADVFGKGNKDPRTFKLPSNWEWLDREWQIDMNGIVGKEIDKDGWEYATNFLAFSLSNTSRTMTPADCVRRRRWIRKRIFHHTVQAHIVKSMASKIVWEVVTNPDESNSIVLKSTKVVKNDLPLDIEITFETRTSAKYVIPANTSLSLTLQDVHQEEFHMRPHNSPMISWSAPMPLVAEGVGIESEVLKVNKCDNQNLNSLWFGYFLLNQDGIFTVIVRPLLEIYNYLPCPIECRFSSRDETFDSIEIEAGGMIPVTSCSAYDEISTTLLCGRFTITESFRVPNRDKSTDKDIVLIGPDEMTMTFIVRSRMNAVGVLSFVFYSTLLFIDKSNLQLALCVQKSNPIQKSAVGNYTFAVTKMVDAHTTDSVEIGPMSWAVGAHGLALFEPGENKFAISTKNGQASMKNLTVESFGASKTNYEIFDAEKQCFYHVSIKCEPYPLAADLTRVLTVVSSFHVVNCLSEALFLRQKDAAPAANVALIPARQTAPWHSPGTSVDFNVYLRIESCDWSLGTLNINEIGTTTLILPNSGPADPNSNSFRVINAEVRFSEPDDPSYITIVIWESSIRRNARTNKVIFDSACAMSVRNASAVPLIVRQANVNVRDRLRDQRRNIGDDEVKFEAFVPPGEWIPFGWTDPDSNMELEISIPSSISTAAVQPLIMNMMEIGSQGVMDISAIVQHHQLLVAKVSTHSNGRVLAITGDVAAYDNSLDKDVENLVRDSSNDISLLFKVQTISLSVVADKPFRRELFNVYFEKISLFMQHVAKSEDQAEADIVEFTIQDMQIDNFSETAVYPVLLTSLGVQERKDRKTREKSRGLLTSNGEVGDSYQPEQYLNCFEFSMYREVPEDQNTPIVKSVAFRLLQLNITLDSASILVYVTDLHSDILEKASNRQLSDKLALTLDAKEFNDKTFVFLQSDRLNNIEWQYTISQQNKMFIEHLTIHPMRVSLSFYPTKFPRSTKDIHPSLRWMRSLEKVASVEDFELKIHSYIAYNVMEPIPRLMESIGTKVLREIRSNLVKIAGNLVGSLSLLGKPAGLYKKIGSGVEDFFYEPYQGLMESPRGFVTGIGKGTRKLISGVASGVVGSASNIVGSATGGVASVARGMALISGNEKLVQRSEDRRRELKASGGGVMAGLKAGGESVVSGFSAGISGLVTKPIEAGRKGGAVGFLKGVGQGIIGVAVNPVMGVSEGISSVAQGINRSFSSDAGTMHVRPRRALYRRDPDAWDEVVLVTINVFQAEAQNFVEKRAHQKNYSDEFIAATELGFPSSLLQEDDPYGLILSKHYLFLVSLKFKVIWSIQLSVISHIELSKLSDGKFVLKIVEYDLSPGLLPRQVVCMDKRTAAEAYDVFVHVRKYFGNPRRMEPSENVLLLLGEADSPGSRKLSSSSSSKANTPRQGGAASSDSLSSDFSPEAPPKSHVSSSTAAAAAGGEAEESPPRQDSELRRMSGVSSSSVPDYVFGTANATKLKCDRLSEKTILQRAADLLMNRCRVPLPISLPEDKREYHKLLDEAVWRIVSDWNANHDMIINSSRCCVCLVINHSRSSIQLLRTELREGADLKIFGVGEGYDETSRSLKANGGSIVVFAKGNRPSLVSKEHVKFDIVTTAFKAMMATRENRSECRSQAGFHAPFLEKSRTDWWAKYVIVVS